METNNSTHAASNLSDYKVALRFTLITLAICTILVVLCYYFIDRPVAFFVHKHKFKEYEWLKWLTYPPPWAQSWSPAVIALLVVYRAFAPLPRFLYVLFVACLSLLVADQFRSSIGDLCGRYWPETWINNNPSLIGTGTYGFHPFQSGDAIGSFPSGHAARILGFSTVLWLAMPRGRVLYALVAIPMLIALIGMDYHFVGDVIAGSFLGVIVGNYAAILANIKKRLATPHS